MSGDERSIWADKAYSRTSDKQRSRASSVYYGVLDKGKRGRKLSNRQRGRNRQKSSVRSAVEHPFAYMKEKLHYACARAKTQARNELDFTMNCILYNVFRADFLLRKQLAIQMETG
ncbi:MAG: transposase [Planctomycetes bacterium]|nr:transposase [Planctomycetota bacterium]